MKVCDRPTLNRSQLKESKYIGLFSLMPRVRLICLKYIEITVLASTTLLVSLYAIIYAIYIRHWLSDWIVIFFVTYLYNLSLRALNSAGFADIDFFISHGWASTSHGPELFSRHFEKRKTWELDNLKILITEYPNRNKVPQQLNGLSHSCFFGALQGASASSQKWTDESLVKWSCWGKKKRNQGPSWCNI